MDAHQRRTSISVVGGSEDPYRAMIGKFLGEEFPSVIRSPSDLLTDLTNAFLASNQVRYGPLPNPESLVAIRGVLSHWIGKGEPIPVLMPWGSKKPDNDRSIDVAELSALKMLECLRKRVLAVYPPGLTIRMRLEDVSGHYLFASEGADARRATARYVNDFMALVRVTDLGELVTPVLESGILDEGDYFRACDGFVPLFIQYLKDSTAYVGDPRELPSWQALAAVGWLGVIPAEQRHFYLSRYERLYPRSSESERLEMLGRYFATTLERGRKKATGSLAEWGGKFLKLYFGLPIPGVPVSLMETTIHYRTVLARHAMTHIPPWRAIGYLRVEGDEIVPKLSSCTAPLASLRECNVQFASGDEIVSVRADYLIE